MHFYIHTELPNFQASRICFSECFKNHEIHEIFRLYGSYVIVCGSYTVQLHKYHDIYIAIYGLYDRWLSNICWIVKWHKLDFSFIKYTIQPNHIYTIYLIKHYGYYMASKIVAVELSPLVCMHVSINCTMLHGHAY